MSTKLFTTRLPGGCLLAGARLAMGVTSAPINAQTTLTTLPSFPSHSGDGQNPLGIAAGPNGSIYGATQAGGTGSCYSVTFGGSGCGTVFQLTPPAVEGGAWTETNLYSFTGQNGDGAFPSSGVVVGANGEVYGTTVQGGSSGFGIVFELAPPVSGGAWTEQILYSFSSALGPNQFPRE